ncbi:MAG: hypothetical protein WA485_24120 [Candidatus Sulfotelmatobacter sp.]
MGPGLGVASGTVPSLSPSVYGTIGWLPNVTTFYYSLAIVPFRVWPYLRDMNERNDSRHPAINASPLRSNIAGHTRKLTTLTRSALGAAVVILALAASSRAAELPGAPSSVVRANIVEAAPPVQVPTVAAARSEVKVIDKTFVSLALVSTGSTFADSYTTLFARENWLAGKKGVCNVEVESAYLYGTHPTVRRAYAVASLKSAGSVFAAYYLRKHHNKFWSLPLVANSVISLQGVGQNMATCN